MGSLYGTTWLGGDTRGDGVAFKLSPPSVAGGPWEESVFAFGGSNGSRPRSALTADTFGALYGTTTRGGTGNCSLAHCGTLFRLTPPRTSRAPWAEIVLANFNGMNGGDPAVGPIFIGPNLYGTAEFGGDADVGVVFRLAP
jgi:hypothetical protein